MGGCHNVSQYGSRGWQVNVSKADGQMEVATLFG